MKIDNPFDKRLALWGERVPREFRDAAVEVVDTLELSTSAAVAVFEEKAKPEHALRICEMILARVNARAMRDAADGLVTQVGYIGATGPGGEQGCLEMISGVADRLEKKFG